MKEIEIEYDWTWDDDGQLGFFTVDCPCGERLETECFTIGDDKLKCKCGAIYSIKRTTKLIVE